MIAEIVPVFLDKTALVATLPIGIAKGPLRVLEKIVGLSFAGQDIFVNVVGGLKLSETGCDLGILAALASSHRGKALQKGTVLIGEAGLSGELRPVSQTDLRLAEIERLGFRRVLLSHKTPKPKKNGLDLHFVKDVNEALEILL